ncbi:glycerophosphoryl diester phosphodiesterase membrane domain-containing protein [Paraurantiacibacter namhicola]|uniref:Glycerophosphoryl diester phosphodiesterase membrane domain-containing protein n=1 Tax=Paraurantiacibacter namhicola TaxID=645517 RepID=A0A1C7DBD1_9SPHN|nr:glycerophosphoryl diester phosphodiesterase membrane domain-containing protein [Paraurantiacibacter namhicola]ANU08754.1 hypothetical protein A6F65_02473 [Paraurantiacibacter namhicola]
MKFDMGAAWRDATTMMAGNKEVLLVVAGIFFFLPALVVGLMVPSLTDILGSTTDPEAMQEQLLALYAGYGWLFVLAGLAQVAGYIALLALLRDASRPTVGDAIKAGLVGMIPAFVGYILASVLIGLVLMLLVGAAALAGSTALTVIVSILALVIAIYMYVKFSLLTPVIALEGTYNPIKALARSWKLSKGNSLRLFLFYLLLFIVYFIVAMVVGLVVGLLVFALGDTLGLTINAILSGLIGAGFAIIFVSVLAAIHRQLAGPSAGAVSETFE